MVEYKLNIKHKWGRIMFEKLSEALKLYLDKETRTLYGNYEGYTTAIKYDNNDKRFKIYFSLAKENTPITKELFLPLKTNNKIIPWVRVSHRKVEVAVKGGATTNGSIERLQHALDECVTFFKSLDIYNICETTENKETNVYYFGNNLVFLSNEGFELKSRENAQAKETVDQTKEQFLPGIIGAILGALIGVVAIVIIGQLGYVSIIGGLIMGVTTIKGYELFAKKMSKKGVFISFVVMIAMVLFAYLIDWGMFIAKQWEMNVFDAIRIIPDLLTEEYIDKTEFYLELGKLYLFSVIGFVPMIFALFSEKANKFVVRRLG